MKTEVADFDSVALQGLLQALSPVGRIEVERVLTARLQPTRTPTDRRLTELGPLAAMLCHAAGERGSDRPPLLTADLYDEHRPPGAVSSETLSQRYGSWRKVCRAAWGLLRDGRWQGTALPWPGNAPPPAYQLAEVRATMRRCALGLGRRPTVAAYLVWRRGRGPATARQRLPAYGAIRRHYRTWQSMQRDIPVSDLELAQARALRLPAAIITSPGGSAVDALTAVSTEGLCAAGFSDDERRALLAEGVAALTVPRAASLATALGGSLQWLAGKRIDAGSLPTGGASFQPARVRELRGHRSVSDATVRHVARYAAGPWAAVMRGTRQPTLGAVARLAELLGVEVDELCTE